MFWVKLDSLSLNKEVENLLDYLEYLSDEKEICFRVECNQQIFADKNFTATNVIESYC